MYAAYPILHRHLEEMRDKRGEAVARFTLTLG
jgi:hypothetical protein